MWPLGRLKPGITYQEASAQFNSLLHALAQVHPENKGQHGRVVDITTATIGKSSKPLYLLLAAVLVLLTIGCVNIAGLLSSRGVAMQLEIAVRSALGAGRLRLLRQFAGESLLYSALGGALGVALALALLRLISTLLTASLARGSEVTLSPTVLFASLAAALCTGLLASFLPALRLSVTSASLALRAGGRSGADRQQRRLRSVFAVTEIALALILLVTAGVLFRSLAGLRNADLGFDPTHVLTTDVELSPGTFEHRNVLDNFYHPLLDRVRAIPGVQAAGLIQVVPIQSWGWNAEVTILGQPPAAPNQEHLAEIRIITPGYYATFRDRLVQGRLVDNRTDLPSSPRVTVVNETFVKRFIPNGEDPIGKVTSDGEDKVTIVGVVRDIRQNIYEPPLAQMDWPVSQIPPQRQLDVIGSMHLLLRTSGRPETIVGALRKAFHDTDAAVPFRTAETMPDIIAGALRFERLQNWLFGCFATLAAVLALVGLYGLVSQEVALSTREIGVRMALGANRRRILGLIYRRVGTLVFVGLCLGLFGTYAIGSLIAAVITTHGQQTWQTAALLASAFAAVAFLAASLPAQRATRVDPMQALRAE